MTLRIDYDVLWWARIRAWFGMTSINALVAGFLEEYAAVPDRWRQGLPPPWTPENRIRPVLDPKGLGLRAASAHLPPEVIDAAIAQVIWESGGGREAEEA